LESILLLLLISRLIITYDNNKRRKERKALKKLKTIALLVASCLLLTGCGCQKEETYTVSFDTAGGSTVSSIEVEEGQTATKPTDPTRDGYTFAGWYNGDTEYTFTQKVTANITLTAKWTENSTSDKDNTTTPTTPDTTDTDKDNSDGSQTTIEDTTASLTLGKSKVTLTVGNSYTVKATTKNTTGSVTWTSSDESIATVKNGKITAVAAGTATITASINGISKTVKVTVNAKSTSTGTSTSNNNSGSTNTTTTTTNYTVTFNTNGGSAVTTKTVKSGEKVSAPTAPTKDGYTFDGWYSDAALTKAYSFSSAVTSNITLYAKWTTASYTYTILSGTPAGYADMIVAVKVYDPSGKEVTSGKLQDASGSFLGSYESDAKGFTVNKNDIAANPIAKIKIDGKTYDIKSK
jgi:uncharacterized repeat protein (TIGR02543 family)